MKNKTLVFISGLVLGCGIASLAFYLVVVNPFSSNDKVAVIVNEKSVDLSEKNSAKIEYHETKSIDYKPIVSKDTSSDYYPHIDENSPLLDSLLSNESTAEIIEVGEGNNFDRINDEKIKKEQMIAVGTIPFINRIMNKQNNKTDSLLSKSNNIKLEKSPANYDVEFWETPLNSKGYRLGKNKIAIYGLEPTANYKMIQLNEGLFLEMDNQYYKIEKSTQFKNFIKVSNKDLLDKLKDEN